MKSNSKINIPEAQKPSIPWIFRTYSALLADKKEENHLSWHQNGALSGGRFLSGKITQTIGQTD